MRRFGLVLGVLALAFFAVGIYGCSNGNNGGDTDKEKSENGDDHRDHGDHQDHSDHGAHGQNGKTEMEKMKEELAKLSPADAASAEKQHFCPVSDKMLGTMGPPKKVDVNGQDVWICCGGCEDKLLKNPDKYLAKVNKN